MSYCRDEGKDKVIFVTKEDHTTPSAVKVNEYSDDEPGLILDNGDINWNCPCLGGMATGPCGYEFREAFSCFHVSKADPKGSDCFDEFRQMQDCMIRYPKLYESASGDDDDGNEVEDVFATADEAEKKNRDEGSRSGEGSKVEQKHDSRSAEKSSRSNVADSESFKNSKDSSESNKQRNAT